MEAVTSGLGLIDQYIIPHADQPDRTKITQFYRQQISKIGETPIFLGEDDVYIINGDRYILKQDSQ